MKSGRDDSQRGAPANVSFAALRHPGFRAYFALSALAMMADSIEHVISYWVMSRSSSRRASPVSPWFRTGSHSFFSWFMQARSLRGKPDALPEIRGRVIGLYSMASLGLRAFSGVTVGVLGSLIGIHRSLAASAMALLAITAGLLAFAMRVQRR
jgi:hypothetical protein